MNFDSTLAESIGFKAYLFNNELPKFAVRSMLAGLFLTIITAFAAVAATAVEAEAPGFGKFVFAGIFASALYVMVVLGAELATGNMMFSTYGSVTKRLGWLNGFALVVVCTLFNLLGVLLTAYFITKSTAFEAVDPDNFLAGLTSVKLAKDPQHLFLEGIFANIVVNIGILMAVQAGKDFTAKLFAIILVIPAFAAMGYEHSIASFVIFSLSGYGIGPEHFEGFTLFNGLSNWLFVWLGNYVGGGLLMGGVYAWLNKGVSPQGSQPMARKSG